MMAQKSKRKIYIAGRDSAKDSDVKIKRETMRFWVVLILFLIAACAAKTPTGTLTSEAPLSAADEERVLADINPTLEAKAAEITKPETSIAIPDEYLDLQRKIVQEGSLVEQFFSANPNTHQELL